jgi:hypothetical protein
MVRPPGSSDGSAARRFEQDALGDRIDGRRRRPPAEEAAAGLGWYRDEREARADESNAVPSGRVPVQARAWMTFAAKISATAGVAERQDAGRCDTPAEDRYVEQSGPPRVSAQTWRRRFSWAAAALKRVR